MGPRRVVVAVDIGGTTVKGALYSEAGVSLVGMRTPTFPDADRSDDLANQAIEAVTGLVDRLVASAAAEGYEVTGVGICSPGLVDSTAGLIVLAVNLGWTALPIVDILHARVGVPVALDHDARAAARAEQAARRAVGRDADNLVFIPIGTGIAATVVNDGSIMVGAGGAAGEFGHVPVVPDGELCTCGQRGCVEVYASAGSVLRRYREAGGAPADDTRAVVARVDTDPIATRVWCEAIEALAAGIVMLTAVLDPGVVVIGGGLGEAGEALLAPLRRSVADRLTWRNPPRIEQSLVGSVAGLAGAALLVGAAVQPHPEQET